MAGSPNSSDGRRLHLHDRIGSGGFGDVYRATMVSAGGVETLVAVKVLHKDSAPSSQALERLRDEGKMLGLIRHPAIVRVLDMVVLDGRAALVTEYVEGVDLGFLVRRRALGPRALVELVGVVAGALNAAFNVVTGSGAPLNLVHRDVKPENIRLGRHGDVKLLDFGIAKAGGIRREAKTAVGDVVGSYRYMAPERLSRKREDRPEGDVFSLGAVLYEGLSGERLFHGLDLRDQVRLAADGEAFAAFVRGRMELLQVSPRLRALLASVLAFDPSDRPSAHRLAAACDELVDGLEGPNLRQWCRSWDWPTEDAAPGPLTGKSVVDVPSNAPSRAAPEAERPGITLMVFDDEPPVEPKRPTSVPPPAAKFQPRADPASDVRLSQRPSATSVLPVARKAGRFEVMLGAVTSAIVAVLFAIGIGVLGAMVAYAAWREGRPVSVDEVAVAVEPARDEPPPPPPALAPAPTPEVAPEPAPAAPPAPAQRVAPVAPAPAPVGHAPGTLVAASKVPVKLRGEGGVYEPGAVPVGAYALLADFGEGFESGRTEPVTVLPGSSITVRCTVLKRLCEVTVVEAASGG